MNFFSLPGLIARTGALQASARVDAQSAKAEDERDIPPFLGCRLCTYSFDGVTKSGACSLCVAESASK